MKRRLKVISSMNTVFNYIVHCTVDVRTCGTVRFLYVVIRYTINLMTVCTDDYKLEKIS